MHTIIRSIFPLLERSFRFLRTDARQDYLIGTVRAPEPLEVHLRTHGFEDQLLAWVDDGQIASLRKRDGEFQYHIRIFNDGEVRGHYEYAPEIAPIKHLRRINREARTNEFREFVRGHVSFAPTSPQQATISPVRQEGLSPSYRA